MPVAAYVREYGDYGSMNTIIDVILGVRKRTKWWCPHCQNTAPGEEGLPLENWEAEEHLEERCPVRTITCAACGDKVPVCDRLDHVEVCKGKCVECERCGCRVRECYIASHLKKCVPFGASGALHLRLDPQCIVSHMMEGGVAEAAGVRLGDLIVRVSNPTGVIPIASREDFMTSISPRSEVFRGTPVTLHVVRDPHIIQSVLEKPGQWRRDSTAGEIRAITMRQTEGVVPIDVVMGPETAAAKENRLKKLERLRTVFKDIRVEVVDDFVTNPKKCREHVLAAWATQDPGGAGALLYEQINAVFVALAAAAGVDAPSREDTRMAFKELSRDGNGVLTFDEFHPYLRCMVMEVVWAEGTLAPCPHCRRRTRERNQARHAEHCCGDVYPRGSLHFDVEATHPLKITDVGPAAQHAGLAVGDVVTAFNGAAVKSRLELAKAASFTKGVLPGREVPVEVKRPAAANGVATHTFMLTVFPLTQDSQIEQATRLAAAVAKAARDSKAAVPQADVIHGLVLGGAAVRAMMRRCFDAADDVGNGFLQRRDMPRVFRLLNEEAALPLPEDRKIQKLFDKIDPRENGSVSFAELYPVLRLHFLAELELCDKGAVLASLE